MAAIVIAAALAAAVIKAVDMAIYERRRRRHRSDAPDHTCVYGRAPGDTGPRRCCVCCAPE